jgi:hypothetical protein
MSEWLLDYSGFLPVPIIITEPAVGVGGGAALVFFSESLRDAAKKQKCDGHLTPPDIYGLGAFATENGTKGAAAGGQWTFLDDRYRYRGGIGQFKINLDFYGIGGQLPVPIASIGCTLEGCGSFQQAMMRLGFEQQLHRPALGLPRPGCQPRPGPGRRRPDAAPTGQAQLGPGPGLRARLARQHLHAEQRVDRRSRRDLLRHAHRQRQRLPAVPRARLPLHTDQRRLDARAAWRRGAAGRRRGRVAW